MIDDFFLVAGLALAVRLALAALSSALLAEEMLAVGSLLLGA